ncbi:MAG: secretin N-terminal domain-containing protein [Pseudomonadota bacterium]
MNTKRIAIALTLAGLTACSTSPRTPTALDPQVVEDAQALRDAERERPPLVGQMALSDTLDATDTSIGVTPKTYDFVADDLPLARACRLFGQTYGLNMVIDAEVQGNVSVELRDLPFEDIMRSLLSAHGYFWERRGNVVYVKAWQTRTFSVDYIRLVRSGSGSSQAQVASGAVAGGAGGAVGGGAAGGGGVGGAGAGAPAGAMSIEQSDKVDFWQELEDQLATLISEEGRLVVNRLAGMVQVTDRYPRVQEIAAFIEQLNSAIYRQVDIDVKIVEVELNDDASLGVDWSRFVQNGDGEFIQGNLSTLVLNPAGGLRALPPTATIGYSNIEDGLNQVSSVLTALREQGEVRIVSQPHIRTLNNQSALIKVGTDRTFFRKEQVSDATNAGTQTFSTDVPQVVTEGIVLSITPQISASGWITMDVSPVVTRVSSVSEVLDANGNVQSTAPNLDISQASSLVRARDGSTIVIGGLIQDQTTDTRRTVPGLGRVPLLGRLFGSDYTTESRKELIMLLTPRLIDL